MDKENIGADDIVPVLNYIFIQAHPLRIFTDLEFIKLFLKKDNNYEINQVQYMFEIICNYTPKSFNITPEEYRKRCMEALNGDKN